MGWADFDFWDVLPSCLVAAVAAHQQGNSQNVCLPNLVANLIGHPVIIVWAIKCNLQHTVNATISKRCEVGFVNKCGIGF